MPITLPPLTRRRWLQNLSAASAAWATAGVSTQRSLQAAIDSNHQTWVLFSDTHIAADPKLDARETCMADNLARCINQVLDLGQKPFGLFVNGDCAYLDGQQEDYATFVRLLQPLRETAIPVHCSLGNHDNRKNFLSALTHPEDSHPLLKDNKHVDVVSSALVNWVILDSLDQVNQTPGLLGQAQLGWLDRTLRNLPEKPTIVMTHHNPQGPVTPDKKPTALVDSDALFQVIAEHKKVRALIYGHTHTWAHSKHEGTGIQLINLPPVAYVFNQARPNGWVVARVDSAKMELELRALNPANPSHGEKVTVLW